MGEISGNNIIENTSNANGGAIVLSQDCQFTISNNIICYNWSQYNGGGMGCYEHSSALLSNNILYENVAYYNDGGGIDIWNDSVMAMTNNTIYTNSSLNMNGGGINCEGSSITISNTIFWNNGAIAGPEMYIEDYNNIPSIVTISYSDLEGGQGSVQVVPGSILNWGPGMIDADPLFVDSVKGDFHLKYESPCKDRGDHTAAGIPEKDFEGDPRIAFGDVDMGSDEFYTHLYITGDCTPGGKVEIKFVGLPGSAPVGLWIGTDILDPPLHSIWGDWYLEFPIYGPFILGPIPNPGGILVFPCTVPMLPPAPYSIPLQALIGEQMSNYYCINLE
jgi:hypothetical protein